MSLITTALAALALLAPAAPDWFDGSYNEALRAARRAERPVLLAFVSPDSDYSRALEQQTLVADELAERLSGYLMLRIDAATPEGRQLVELHHVASLPSLLFLDTEGRPDELIAGFIPARKLAFELDRVAGQDQTVSMFRAAVAAAGDDLQARFDLATKLQWVGDTRGHEREIATIRERDPGFETRPGALLHLYDLMWAVIGDEQESGTFEVGPVQEFLATTTHDGVLFEGWNWIAAGYEQRERDDDAWAARAVAFEHVGGDAGGAQWCHDVATALLERGDELGDDGRAFAQKAASWAAHAACQRTPQCDADGTLIAGAGERLLASRADGAAGGGDGDGDAADGDDGYPARIAGFLETLARAQALNGNTKDAKAAYQRCQQLDPGRSDEYAKAITQLGRRHG